MRVHPMWHLIPVGFMALWIVLGIHSLWADDARFGWGMFKKHVDYRVSYSWIMEDGTSRSYTPADELRGPARRLMPGRSHWTTYSVGAVRSWVRGYTSYMMEHGPPAVACGFRAVLIYRVNRRGPAHRVVIEQRRGG